MTPNFLFFISHRCHIFNKRWNDTTKNEINCLKNRKTSSSNLPIGSEIYTDYFFMTLHNIRIIRHVVYNTISYQVKKIFSLDIQLETSYPSRLIWVITLSFFYRLFTRIYRFVEKIIKITGEKRKLRISYFLSVLTGNFWYLFSRTR